MNKPFVLWSLTALLFSAAGMRAAGQEAEMIEGKVTQFYQQLREGQFQEAFANFAEGSRGYLPYGLLRELPNQQVISMVVAQYAETREKGGMLDLQPSNIKVTIHGDVALATFYVDGEVRNPGEEIRGVVTRCTMVWAKQDDAWKIIHWHVSDLKAGPGDD